MTVDEALQHLDWALKEHLESWREYRVAEQALQSAKVRAQKAVASALASGVAPSVIAKREQDHPKIHAFARAALEDWKREFGA